MKTTIKIAVGALLFAGTLAAVADTGVSTVGPDAAFQAAIAGVMNASTPEQTRAALDRLADLDGPSRQRLIPQLLHYSVQADDMKHVMAAGFILQQLHVADGDIVRALFPILDTADTKLRDAARNVLGGIEGRSAGRRPDFSFHRDIIAERVRAGEPLPDGLIRHMYDSDPGEALLALMRAHQLRKPYEIKPILWAEHVVSDVLWKQQYGFLGADKVEPAAAQELAKLAAHKAWWARLYVAHIMLQNRAFRQPVLIERLRSDDHAWVREAVAEIDDSGASER